jgi:hypothetical protein
MRRDQVRRVPGLEQLIGLDRGRLRVERVHVLWPPRNATSAKEKKEKELLASPKSKSEVKNNIN